MREKKPLWIVTAAILLSSLFVGSTAAPTFPTLSVDPQVVWGLEPGTTFSVYIVVDYVETLFAYQYELTFNPDVLQGIYYDDTATPPIPVEDSGWLGDLGGLVIQSPGQGWDNVNGKLQLTGASVLNPMTMRPDPAYCPTGGGILSIVIFEVIGYCESPLEFQLETGLLDPNGVWIIHGTDNVVHGYFTNHAGPELYIRQGGSGGGSGAWPEWHQGYLGDSQRIYSGVSNKGEAGAWVKVLYSISGDFATIELWSNEAELVADTGVESVTVQTEEFVPVGPGYYTITAQLWFKTGAMLDYAPYDLVEGVLGGVGTTKGQGTPIKFFVK